MFEINGTLPIFVISFLVFMFIFDAILLKPVARVIERRDEKIKADLEAGKSSREQAQKLLERYEQDLRDIREKAQKLIADSSDQANKERMAELAGLQKEGLKKLEEAKAALQAERTELIDELVTQLRDLVETITQKVLGERIPVHLDASQIRGTLEGGN